MKRSIKLICCLTLLALCAFGLGSCNENNATCKISYYIDNNTAPITTEVQKGSVVEHFEPTVEGYDFLYWRYEDGTRFDESAPVEKDVILYAVLELKQNFDPVEYAISFNLAGGQSTQITNIVVNAGDSITLPDSPLREGYLFKGWKADEEEYQAGATYLPTGNVTFVANWVQAISVTYDYNYNNELMTTQYEINSLINLPSTIEIAGQTINFAMWFDGVAFYLPGASYQLTNKEITLEAMYNGEYNVSFDFDEGTGILPVPTNYQSGDTIILPITSDVTKEKYTLIGWTDGFSTYEPGSEYTVLYFDTVLTAVWEINASNVTFLDWDGSVLEVQSVFWGEDAVSPTHPVLQVEEFVGWNKDITNINSNLIVRAVYNYTSLPITSFIFTLNPDLNSYSVTSSSKLAVNLASVIYLPHSYNGKLVTGISSFTDGLPSIDQEIGFFQCNFIEEVYLPSTYKTIGSSAFFNCKGLKNVHLASTSVLERIERSAFYSCDALVNFTFPETVNYIGESAFNYCHSFTSIDLSKTAVKTMNQNAFSSCTNLEAIQLPNGLETILNSAFYNTALKSITFGASLKTLGRAAFNNCLNLQEIIFETTLLDEIGVNCFSVCEKLTSITIPSSVTSIGDTAFYRCSALKEVKFAANSKITRIGEAAFGRCDALVNFNSTVAGEFQIPDSVVEIAKNAFVYDTGIISVVFGENSSLTTLGDNAFSGHHTLESTNSNDVQMNIQKINLPKTLTSLGVNVFMNCNVLAEINLDVENQAFKSLNNLLITGDGKTVLAYPAANPTKVLVIPEGVETIEGNIFYQHPYLEEVTIPTTLRNLSNQAFMECAALKKVTILEGLEVISEFCFANCPSLAEIYLPSSIKEIMLCGIGECVNLTKVEFAANSKLETIGQEAFSISFASGSSLTIPKSVKIIGWGAFGFCEGLENVTIEANSLLETIEGYAFYDSGLKSLIIPRSVTTLGTDIFNLCSNLKTVTFEEGSPITVIPDRTFMESGLTSYTIPTAVTELGVSVFVGTAITEVVMSDNVTVIGRYAFYQCRSLKSITLSKNIKILEIHALSGCSNLEIVNLPSELETISNYVFADCTSLKTLTIPDKVSMIGMSAFLNTTSLESITVLAKIPPILSSIINPDVQTAEIVQTIFSGSSIQNIYVPSESFVVYQTSWEYYQQLIKRIGSDVNA